MWYGKVLAQVVKSNLIVWKDLGSSLMYANYLLYGLLLFCFGNVIVNSEW